MDQDSDPLARSRAKPEIKTLLAELKLCAPTGRMGTRAADDVRFCRWPNQTADGKKHDSGDSTAFPWDGASDTRPMTADRIIGETVPMMKEAFWRSTTKQKAADDQIGAYAVALVDHFVNEAMTARLVREVELSAQYACAYGWFVLHPSWEQKLSLKRQKVTLKELAAIGEQLAQADSERPELAHLGAMILEPTLEEHAIELLKYIYKVYAKQNLGATFEVEIPQLKDKALRSALKKLREKGEAEIAVPYVCKDGPSITALKPWDEIFLPEDTTDIEDARLIVQREWLTEAQLLERQRTEGYDEAWCKLACKARGKGGSSFWGLPEGVPGRSLGLAGGQSGAAIVSTVEAANDQFIEVLHCVYRAVDSDDVPGIYCTTIQPSTTKNETGAYIWAKHELLDYPHGDYPYVGGAREYFCRRFVSSRGIPEIVATRQHEKKALLDAMIDRTSITVMPPVNVYPTAGGTHKYRFGPAVQNVVMLGKEPKFMEMPSGAGMAEADASIQRIDFEVDNLFGLRSEKVPPERSQSIMAGLVQTFLVAWTQALQQLVSLAQRYMSDKQFSDVTGAPLGWLDAHRDKPGALQAQLTFDVRELDPELIAKRIEAMSKAVLPSDVTGAIDRRKWVELQLRAINPAWAKELIMPGQAASQKVFNDVKNDIAQMFLGNEATYVESDATAGTKLQYAQQIVSSNPNYQQALQSGGRFPALMDKWSKSLNFSLEQEKNKQVGRIGVQPESPQA